jgi:hypothetical protein
MKSGGWSFMRRITPPRRGAILLVALWGLATVPAAALAHDPARRRHGDDAQSAGER